MMKSIQNLAEAENFSAVNIGFFNQLSEHVFVLAPGIEIPGKVFVNSATHATGSEISFTSMPANQGLDFLHQHKGNEETYVVLHGNGEFQVDGKIFKISEGSVVRVSPLGKRCWRNTGGENLVMMCVQTQSSSLEHSTVSDGLILDEKVCW